MFFNVFEVVGGYGLRVSLQTRVVGVAAPSEGFAGLIVLERTCILSDIAGLCIMKILHCGEGGDVKQVARALK